MHYVQQEADRRQNQFLRDNRVRTALLALPAQIQGTDVEALTALKLFRGFKTRKIAEIGTHAVNFRLGLAAIV